MRTEYRGDPTTILFVGDEVAKLTGFLCFHHNVSKPHLIEALVNVNPLFRDNRYIQHVNHNKKKARSKTPPILSLLFIVFAVSHFPIGLVIGTRVIVIEVEFNINRWRNDRIDEIPQLYEYLIG